MGREDHSRGIAKTLTTEANVAVLIDYENVGLGSIQYLLDQLSDVGRVIIKRAYADWSAQGNKRDQLLELGIEAVHHFRSSKSGKNSSDICLAIDAIDLLYGAPVDTFVIVSSDSDFVPLVSKLRAAGKVVIGAGRRETVSPTLIKSCDRYIYLDEARPSSSSRKSRSRVKVKDSEIASLVIRAMEASMDQEGRVLGSRLHQTILRIDPSFDFRALGFRTFSQFLASRKKEVTVTRPPDASDVIVQLNSAREQGEVEEAPAPKDAAKGEAEQADQWDRQVDAAWSRRQRPRLSTRVAASDAAKVLGVPNLRSSRYPTLDKLLAASEFLRSRWRRERNFIVQR